jgi:hypothetical protein
MFALVFDGPISPWIGYSMILIALLIPISVVLTIYLICRGFFKNKNSLMFGSQLIPIPAIIGVFIINGILGLLAGR